MKSSRLHGTHYLKGENKMKTEKMTGWIPVAKELPKDLEGVSVTCVDVWNRKYVETAIFVRGSSLCLATWVISGWSSPYPKVTAWRPLPKSYKETTK